MSSIKVDFDIELPDGADISTEAVKAGQELNLEAAAPADSGAPTTLRCSTADGVVLGTVPRAQACLLRGELRVTVRMVKRQPGAPDKVAAIQARAVAAAGAARTGPGAGGGAGAAAGSTGQQQHQQHQQQQQQPGLVPEDPSGFAVTVAQLQRLADDPGTVLKLQDERLQKLLVEIDGAPNREKALERALEAEPFRAFADQVLGLLADAKPK